MVAVMVMVSGGGGGGGGLWWCRDQTCKMTKGNAVPTHSVRNASDGWQLMQNRHVATAITVRHSAADTEAEEEAAATRLSAPVPSSSLASLPPLE